MTQATTSQVLKFNAAATAFLGDNTRVRLNVKQRAGVKYAALRPSHRVSGKNVALVVEQVEGTKQAVMTQEQFAQIADLPALLNDTVYEFVDISYGWFVLQPVTEALADTTPSITVQEYIAAVQPTPVATGAVDEVKVDEVKVEATATVTTVHTDIAEALAETEVETVVVTETAGAVHEAVVVESNETVKADEPQDGQSVAQ